MKLSTILDHIDGGHMALPEFQRGYVWNRDQVRALLASLYRRYPVGGLLVWATESHSADHRGEGRLASGIVKLLLDGQQRITSLYGVVRGHPPAFFDGRVDTFTGVQFNLEQEVFAFYQPSKMQGDPLWIDVTALMQGGNDWIGHWIAHQATRPELAARLGTYSGRLNQLLGILDVEFHISEVTGSEMTLDVVVEIFNRVNSGGTKLSQGDLALARVCAEWPEARAAMKKSLARWNEAGYSFTLDWLLRSVNTTLTGEAKFSYLEEKSAEEVARGLEQAIRHIDSSLNLIDGRLGLDHDRVFFGRFAVPVMVRYLANHEGSPDQRARDQLLFWYLQSGMWGRFSGSTESFIDKDLAALETGGLEGLLEELRLWHGALRVEAGHFAYWSRGARFYPVLYWLTRMGEARDWGTGLPLKSSLHGRMNKLEVHHIFPKARLYPAGYDKTEVNSLANYCFLTKDTNLQISDSFPEEYFPLIQKQFPGALESQWIPKDPELWRLENYRDFLDARRELLAQATNTRLAELLHGDQRWLEGDLRREAGATAAPVEGGIASLEEEQELEGVNRWMQEVGLPCGILSYDHSEADSGVQIAIFDLAWPDGIQEELSEPVALLLNESSDTLRLASEAGFRFFTSVGAFKAYVSSELLTLDAADSSKVDGLKMVAS